MVVSHDKLAYSSTDEPDTDTDQGGCAELKRQICQSIIDTILVTGYTGEKTGEVYHPGTLKEKGLLN